jgi:hypothetical protein
VTPTEHHIEHFIATLASMGGSVGNHRLCEALQWQESIYLDIKQRLLDSGRIVARMNMILHGFPTATIMSGDTLVNPKFKDGEQLRDKNFVPTGAT